MQAVQPKVYMLAKTEMCYDNLWQFLDEYYGPEAGKWKCDSTVGAEVLAEVAGRGCYQSFAPGINANVTKVREGNKLYLDNILKQQHGSVIEHGSVTFAFTNVSRVFTHEIVRHRLCAFSQESLRYVRLSNLKFWVPSIFKQGTTEHKQFYEALQSEEDNLKAFEELFEHLEGFEVKKKLTSAIRRIAPQGMATMIIVTTNHRNWRHIISQRTSGAAEEEIRLVVSLTAVQLQRAFPNIYQDMVVSDMVEGIPVFTFNHGRV